MNANSFEAVVYKEVKKLGEIEKSKLMINLGFYYDLKRYKHPNGKVIMKATYDRMNYEMLVNRLKDLGFKEVES